MLKSRLDQELKDAMRARDEVRLRTIRSLRAALKDREIAERIGGEAALTEEQEQAVVQKQVKQRQESIEQYERAGREDLAAKERAELEVLREYMPRQLTDEEVRGVLQQLIAGLGVATPQDLGKVMGEAMRLLRGRADGRRVQQLTQAILTELAAGRQDAPR